MFNVLTFVLTAIGLAAGTTTGYLIRKLVASKQANSVEAKAERILNETKAKQQELLLQAKDKSLKIIDDAKKEEEDRRRELLQLAPPIQKA